jgi:hypothetical protein
MSFNIHFLFPIFESIMDALLDGPSRDVASKLLLRKLSGRISFLAVERVGHHTVEKLFRALPKMEDKASISAELSLSLNRLGGNAMGRSVMVSCAVKEYLEGESAWKAALTKQRGKENWLKEIFGEKEGSDNEDGQNKKKRRQEEKKGNNRTKSDETIARLGC